MAMLEDEQGDLAVICHRHGVSTTGLQRDLDAELARFRVGNTRTPVFSDRLPILLEHAWLIASLDAHHPRIRSAHLVLALLAGVLQFAATDAGWAYPLIAVGLVYGIGQFVESFLLTPRLVGERIGLHPLGVILALMLFGQWLGFWGLLIALPCTALLTIMGRRGLQAWQGSRLYLGD